MPRKRKTKKSIVSRKPVIKEQASLSFMKRYGLQESYASLLLGILAVVIIAVVVFFALRIGRNVTNKVDFDQVRNELEKQLNEQDKMSGGPTYTVKTGDSLSKIAQERYGNMDLWTKIAQINKIENPDVLFVGTQLALPIDLNKTEEYTVKAGDSLWNIAVAKYGDGFRWVDIASENSISNPDWIEAGQKINLPQ